MIIKSNMINMKNKIKYLIVVLIILLNVTCYGKTCKYKLVDIYNFDVKNPGKTGIYLEIFLGDNNISKYQTGTTTIKPKPTSYKFDVYGNRIAVYDIDKYNNSTFNVSVEKEVTTSDISYNINNNTSVGYDANDIYLKPTTHIESDNALIIQKAKELTKNCKNDYDKIKNIFEYVNMTLEYSTSNKYRNKGALSALNNKKGVCEEYATLLTALCRASNIPTRVITGFRTSNDINSVDSSSIYHAWAEVYFKDYGWAPIEATTLKMMNGVREPYWDGLFKYDTSNYVIEGIFNLDVSDIKWSGMDNVSNKKTIKLENVEYFNDINDHWAKKYIEENCKNSLVNGYEDNSFKPDKNITRMEFLVMLERLLEKKQKYYYATDSIYYTDDFVENWAKDEYDKLMKCYLYAKYDKNNKAGYNVINYVFGKKLEQEKYITREEVVALMDPFIAKNGNVKTNFKDIKNSKFISEINKLSSNSIINGYEDSTFKPKGNITRAEVATIFYRCLNGGF